MELGGGFMIDLGVEGGKRGGGSVEGGKWKRWVQMGLEIVLSFWSKIYFHWVYNVFLFWEFVYLP